MTDLDIAPTGGPRAGAAPESRPAPELARVAARLGAEADQRRDELDANCRIPHDLYLAAARAGLFRQLVGDDLGGAGRSPLDWFLNGVELARHDASFGWVVTQGAAELGWIAAGGHPDWARAVLDDPVATSASSTAGLGRMATGDRSARFGGRWGFNTGCQGATWIGGLALLDGATNADGTPRTRWGWVPADRARIVADWDPTGLRGTGSHTTVIEQQEIPLEWTFDPMEPTDTVRGAHRCVVGNGNWPIATAVAATQIGNARRAIDEARAVVMTKTRVPDMIPLHRLADTQRELVLIEGLWQAATAAVERALESMWAEAAVRGELSTEQRVHLHTANVAADRLGVEIVDRACIVSGSAALPRRSVLGRCRRDAHALHRHIATGSASIEANAQMSLAMADRHILV